MSVSLLTHLTIYQKKKKTSFFNVKYVETARRGVSVFSISMRDIWKADSPKCS